MTIFEGERQLCPCYEEGQEFQKLAELKDSGLVIYCHRTCTEDIRQNEAVESKDVFIFYNKKDEKITNSELRSELDKKNISCPRCRKTLDHVQELIQEVKSIERRTVMGICDHCRKKAQTIKKQFCTCDDIVSKFKYIKGEQKDDTKKYVKICLSKMGTLVEDGRTVNKPKQMKYRAHSDLQINRDYSPRQNPKLQQMFYSETHKSDINLNTQMKETGLKEDYLKPSVAFSQNTKPVAISFARKTYESEKSNTMIQSTSLLDSETTSMKTYTGVKELPRTSLKEEKQRDEIFVDTPSMDAKEELKRRHDLSLRQMMRLERDSGVLVSASKRPHIYEIPKIAPWEQKPTSEYHVESETNVKTSVKTKYELGSRKPRDLDFPSKRLVKYGTSRTLQKNLRDSYNEQRKADKYYHIDNKKRLEKSEEKNIKKLEQRSVDKFSPKTKKLDTQVPKLKTWYKKVPKPKETSIKRHFSFFFPKVEKKENQVQFFVSSTDLIIDTQERFLSQAEKKRQQEYQQKLERDQNKISREEIKVQAEEKTRQSVEDQKTYEEEQDRLTKYSKKELQSPPYDEKEKQDKVKWDKFKQYSLKKDEDSNKSEVFQKDRNGKGDRFDELLKKSKKDLMSKPEQRHQIDEIFDKAKKDVKGISELKDKRDDEVTESMKKDLKEKSKQKSKDYPESKDKSMEKGSKDLRAKYDQQNRGLEKEQKIQIKEGALDAKHRGEIEALKKQAIKGNKDIVDIKQEKEIKIKKELLAPSKTLKSNKIKQETSDDMISPLEILKKHDKEKKEISANEKDIVDIKQEKEVKIKKEQLHEKQQKNEEKERLKLMEQTWNEKKLLKKAAEKEQQSKDKEAPSKRLKSNKIKQETSDDMISPLEILKKHDKEKKEISANEKDIVEIKQKKEIKIKTENEELKKQQKNEDKEKLKLMEQMWNEKKLLKKAAEKEQQSKDKEVPSKTLKSNKTKQETSDDMISPLEILKKHDKEKKEISANEKDIVEIKQKKEIKIKTENEELKKQQKNEDKEKLKLMEQMWNEKKLLKKAAEKEQQSKDKEAPSKTLKSNKTKQETSDDMISPTEILKKHDKEKKEISVNEKFIVEIKQKKEIKIKTENEELKKQQKNEEKDRLKLMEQMWNEKKLLKKAAEKEQQSKDKEAPSKTFKSNILKQDTSYMISPSEILKKIKIDKKEMTATKIPNIEIKKEVAGKGQQEMKEKKDYKDKTSIDVSEWQKLQVAHLKEKALLKEKQLAHEAQVAKEKESAKEQAKLKSKLEELRMSGIKIEDTRSDLILGLAEIKQAASKEHYDVETAKNIENECDHGINKRLFCPLCYNPELQLEVISLDSKMNEPTESLKHIVIGEKIYEIKRCLEETKGPTAINFWQNFSFDPPEEITPLEEPVQKKPEKLVKKNIDAEPGKGFLRYALSDRTFIEKGWTVLPTEKVVRKMNVYRMRPAHPEFDWFEHNKSKRLMTYDSGEKLAEFDDNGRGRWYYRSGRLALDYYDAEETNAQQRFVIYSSGEPDERGRTHPITILATFDYLGNGIVFDHAGKIRLKYNQTEGVVLDRSIGPVSHWKWHTLNDPPVLQQVMIDTQLPQKDPEILKLGTHSEQKKTEPKDNEEMLAIEFDNFIKEKSKKLSQKFKPFQIKMKALKINEHFSLRVLDQATVYLIFRDGTTNLKLNIGMILDHKEIVDTETAEVGEVSNSLEQFPARTDSLAGLQRSVAHAQRYERQHAERERRLRRPEACASADQLTAAASPPLRLPLRTVPSGPSSSTGYCCSRKPTNSLYYNTRLL